MVEYLDLLEYVLTNGTPRYGEKKDGTLTVFGAQVKYDLSQGFPLVTTRDMRDNWFKLIIPELLWIMSGSTNANELYEKYGSRLWLRWAQESAERFGTTNGDVGPAYGHQLRSWDGDLDQLAETVARLKSSPETRRAIITYWNPKDVEVGGKSKILIAPCISMLHFSRMLYKTGDDQYEPRMDLIMTQRSCDIPAGAPQDIAEYALLLMMVSAEIGIKPGTLTHNIEDGQIYTMQIPHVRELLSRQPFSKPEVVIKPGSGTIFDHTQEDFELQNYVSHPKLKMPIAQ